MMLETGGMSSKQSDLWLHQKNNRLIKGLILP